MKKRLSFLLVAILCVSLVLPACAPKEKQKAYEEYEKTEYLSEVSSGNAISVGYDADMGENAELLTAASEVMVFESGLPIALKLTLSSDADEEREYSVTDYSGNTLYSGSIACRAGTDGIYKGHRRPPDRSLHPDGRRRGGILRHNSSSFGKK